MSLSCTHISPQLAFNLSNKNEKRKSEFTLLFVTLLFGAAAPLLRLSPESMNLFRRLNQKNRKCAATFSALYWKTSKKKKRQRKRVSNMNVYAVEARAFFSFFPSSSTKCRANAECFLRNAVKQWLLVLHFFLVYSRSALIRFFFRRVLQLKPLRVLPQILISVIYRSPFKQSSNSEIPVIEDACQF